MRKRVIVAAIVATGFALGVVGYATAEEVDSLPQFTSGNVLTAAELNAVVEALGEEQKNVRDLITRVNDLEGQLVCNTSALCNSDPTLSEECQDFVDDCSAAADPEACIQGGVFICEEEELPDDVGEPNVCEEDWCLLSETQRTRCQVFLASCLDNINIPERCVAGALFICTNPIINEPGL